MQFAQKIGTVGSVKTTPTLECFPYVAKPDARVLILGSMPGAKSLAATQYYAHPLNLFWQILEETVGASRDLDYAERLDVLQNSKIALWDVIANCVRQGSLDSAIQKPTIVANDFKKFFKKHPDVKTVLFNGLSASKIFQQHVLKTLGALGETLNLVTLPSTSSAHAGVKREEKLKQWQMEIKKAL